MYLVPRTHIVHRVHTQPHTYWRLCTVYVSFNSDTYVTPQHSHSLIHTHAHSFVSCCRRRYARVYRPVSSDACRPRGRQRRRPPVCRRSSRNLVVCAPEAAAVCASHVTTRRCRVRPAAKPTRRRPARRRSQRHLRRSSVCPSLVPSRSLRRQAVRHRRQ